MAVVRARPLAGGGLRPWSGRAGNTTGPRRQWETCVGTPCVCQARAAPPEQGTEPRHPGRSSWPHVTPRFVF